MLRKHYCSQTSSGLSITTFTASATDVIERVAITIVCRDQFLDPTVKVILDVAHTGEVGDGRIFVSDVLETYSIRTGEKGDTVLRDKK